MGRVLLVFRLVLGDLRRHPGPAVLLVLSTLVATAVLSLGMSLPGATGRLYLQTRAATAGPDVVVVAPGTSRAADTALTSLEDVPGVAARSRTYRTYFTPITTSGGAVRATVLGADAEPGPIDRPLVTSGAWVRPGGVVVERGFAGALGLGVGDRVTVAGRSFPVVGIAVTAARPVYPWATMGGPDGGPSDRSGLVWLHERDTRALAEADVPAASLVYLRLRDPAATAAFRAVYHQGHDPAVRLNAFTWPVIAYQDAVYLRDGQPILIVGGWLLSFMAVAGLSTLAAGRAAGQTRRAGLLKVVGATPGLIAVVLLTEYLALALLADAAGLALTRLVAPFVVNPSGSLLTTDAGPSGPVAAMTTVVAVGVAILTALAPAVRALRTEAVATLAPAVRRPDHLVLLSRLAGLLPVPLLLGLRLVARRPGRALLHAGSTATMAVGLTVLLMVEAQPDQGWDFGGVTTADLMDDRSRLLLVGVTAAMVALTVVNTLTMTWTTVRESQATMAVARTLGATPGQVTAGLATAQLLPALPGALAGIPLGLFAQWFFGHQNTPQPVTPWVWLVPPALLLATAALAAVPAGFAVRRPVAETLRAEAA